MEDQKRRRELSTSSRQAAYCCLYSQSKDGLLEKGVLAKTAKMFSIDRSTIGQLWREINKKIDQHETFLSPVDILTNLSFFDRRSHDRGRNVKWDRKHLRKEIKQSIPKRERGTFQKMSKATKVPKSTLYDMFRKEGLFRRQTSSLRPHLTDENKVAQFFHALDEVYPVAGGDGFADDDDDDDAEEDPYRSVRHRSHITKVMFLCAQARPRWDEQKNEMWDGKIGIWPIGHWAPAERRGECKS